MKKLLLFATVLLLLGGAMPNLLQAQIASVPISAFNKAPTPDKHPIQGIRTMFLDVSKKPDKKTFNAEFKAPEIEFTREAMIIGTISFVIAPYDKKIDDNLDWSLQIDFANGGGFAPISPLGTTITMPYPAGSTPKIRYRARMDLKNNTTVFSDIGSKDLFIKTPTQAYTKPDMIWKINAGSYTPPAYAAQSYPVGDPVLATSNAEGFAYIKLAPGHTKITKPIIFVDGVDFNSEKVRYIDELITLNSSYESNIVRCGVTGWDIFIMGAEDAWDEPGQTEAFREFPKMFDDLKDGGFDVIFLDFAQGATFIQKNAMVLKALINRINAEKDATAKEENIVVGASMGGQVARMALAQMERDNQNHCTRMYVSFDSPQKGANIPLSLQGFSWMAAYTGFMPGNWKSLNSPAAKQMLVETLADDVAKGKITAIATKDGLPISNGGFLPNTLRPAFVAEMAALGYPQKTANISIVDGDERGRNITGDLGVPFPNNAPMMNVTASGTGPAIVAVDLFALSGASTLPSITNGTVFKGKMPFFIEIPSLNISDLNVSFVLNQTLPFFDNAPGCMRGDLRGIRRLINDAQSALNDFTSGYPGNASNFVSLHFPLAAYQPNFSFMPTMSTLDVRNPNNPNEWNWDVNPSILQKNIRNEFIKDKQLTPFFDYYAPEEGNLRHVEIDVPMRNWIKQFLSDTDKDDLTKYQVIPYNGNNMYAYNYRKNHITPVTINLEGTLAVNDGGSYSAFNNPNFYTKNVFEAHLGDFCGGATVTVNGGKFLLGSPTNTERSAILTLTNGNTVDVKSGELNLYNNSKIIIKQGGVANLNAGNIDLKNNSQIIVQAGGKLHIKAGILRVLDNSQIIVEEGGKLIIEPNAMIVLNNGTVTTSSEARIVIKERGTLQLTGINQDGYNFKFSGNGHFAFGNGNILKMEDLNNNPVDFKWKGAGKNLRMIKLNSATLDIPERNVTINSAAVEYLGNSMVDINKGKSLLLLDVKAYETPTKWQTVRYATAFKLSEGEGTIMVRNSTFSGLNLGIDVFAEETATPKSTGYITSNNYNIYVNTGTLFEKCNRGANILNNQGNVNFSNNTTCKDNRVGVFIDSNTKTVSFNACVFDHNGIGSMIRRMPWKGSVQFSNTTISRNVHGSVLYQIKNAVYYDCKILNHNAENNDNTVQNGELIGTDIIDEIGICETDFMCGILDLYNSNIIATQGTEFLNNNFGIYKLVDGFDINVQRDAVILDCTTFDNNKYAVKGKDMVVQNDALYSQPSLGYALRSNNFIQNKEGIRLFDIAYSGKAQLPKIIQMRNNYWQTKLNIGTAPDPMTISFNQKLVTTGGVSPTATDCEHCSTTNSCINYETTPELNALQKECPFVVYPDPDPKANGDLFDKINDNCKCNVAVSENANGASNNVHAQYRMAYAYLVSEKNPDVDKAMALFTPIALLPIAGNEQSTACDHYIRMARAFTDIYPDGNDTEIQTLSRVQKIRAVIYPNPTDNFFNINLEKGAYAISIVDMQGRVMYQQNTEGNLEVETEKWLSGVYQVFITNKNTGTETTEKVVVMRY
jgi:hypothetical protein